MTSREMEKLTAHFNRYFEQDTQTVMHMTIPIKPHIDILVYPPNEKYPFWKLATMGASDFKMPKRPNLIADRNEYIMFVDSEVDMTDQSVANFYYYTLLGVAFYTVKTNTAITYEHSMEWPETEGSDMAGCYIEMPQMIADTDILRCKLGLFKTTACLQVVLLTRAEIDRLLEIGPKAFSHFLYPESDDERPHYLAERIRSEKF